MDLTSEGAPPHFPTLSRHTSRRNIQYEHPTWSLDGIGKNLSTRVCHATKPQWEAVAGGTKFGSICLVEAAGMNEADYSWQESTRWSRIVRVQTADPAVSEAAIRELCQRYYGATRAYFAGLGVGDTRLDDWHHDFLFDRMMRPAFYDRDWDKNLSFRAYLKAACRNYAADRARRETTCKSAPHRAASLDDSAGPAEPPQPGTTVDPFDRETLRAQLQAALDQMHATVRDPARWMIFVEQFLRPVLYNCPALPYCELADRIGVQARQAQNILVNEKRRFGTILMGVVSEDSGAAEVVKGELRRMLRIATASRELDLRIPGDQPPMMNEVVLAEGVLLSISQSDARPSSTTSARGQRAAELLEPALDAWSRVSDQTPADQVRLLLSLRVHNLVPLSGSSSDTPNRMVFDGTLQQLLEHPSPPRESLEQVSKYAKSMVSSQLPGVPRRVWLLLYHASIIAAYCRSSVAISRLTPQQMREAASIHLSDDWFGEPLTGVFRLLDQPA